MNNGTITSSVGDPFMDFISQLMISLIGAGVGAIVGAYFGIRLARGWDREKRKEEVEQTTKDTINSLLDEMNANNLKLRSPRGTPNWISVIGYVGRYEVLSLSRNAFESVVNSGNFSLLSGNLQTKISELYHSVEYCNSLTEKMQNIHATHLYGFNRGEADILINNIWGVLNQEYGKLMTTNDLLITELRSSIPSTNST